MPAYDAEQTLGEMVYSPDEVADWDGTGPDDPEEALDELADRLTDNEAAAALLVNAVLESDFGSYSVMATTTKWGPQSVTVEEGRILGRLVGGNIADLTVNQARTLLQITGMYRNLPIDASSMMAQATTGPEAAEPEYATNDVNLNIFKFDDTTEEMLQFSWYFIDEIDVSWLKMKFLWLNGSGLATEKVVWGVSMRAFADGDVIDQAFGTEVEVTDTWIAQDAVHHSVASGLITPAGAPATAQAVQVRIARKVDHASDDLTGDAELWQVVLQYKESGTAPAAW